MCALVVATYEWAGFFGRLPVRHVNHPDVVALIETAANRFAAGNVTEVVALAVRRLLEQDLRLGALFGACTRRRGPYSTGFR